MTEYNLNFFEAMEALRDGKTITSSESTMWGYRKNRNGDIVVINLVDTKVLESQSFEFDSMEVQAKWRIVEPKKCWLDQRYPNENQISRAMRVACLQIVSEAIKRIEQLRTLTQTSHEMQISCVGVLKDLIGEK